MTLVNSTPYRALDVPTVDRHGRDVVVLVVKATFEVAPDGRVLRAENQAPIRVNEVFRDPEDPESSVKYPSDLCVEKQGTDVVVIGDAIAKTPVKSVDVAVKVRETTVPLRVHGERLFYKGVSQIQIGPAAAFEKKSIIYERAYGGTSDDLMVIEHRNPIGVGVAKNKNDLVGKPAPQIEHPAAPHTTASDRHPPVGFGAIMSHWSPRREFAGTSDSTWEKTRMPFAPPDFNVRYNNVAHPSLVFAEALAPKCPISVLGMTTKGLFAFELPALGLVLRGRSDRSGVVSTPPVIDTVLVEPARSRFEIVVRKAFPIGRGADVLRELRVDFDDG